MKLIADAGSTKTTWIAAMPDGMVTHINTGGINAIVMSEEAIADLLRRELLPAFADKPIEAVRFYGAGCIPGRISAQMERILRGVLKCEDVTAHSDMLLAARALCGNKPGIACILGTGSNSCLYDGRQIVDNVPPLGFILGDEGSGAVLGRKLVSDIFKRRLPRTIADRFFQHTRLSYQQIISRVYREPQPNSFLASLVPFIAENISEGPIDEIVTKAFGEFIERNLSAYAGWQQLPVSFAGSVAAIFATQLKRACSYAGFRLDKIVRYPAEHILQYHIECGF